MYEHNIVAIKERNEGSSWFRIESGVEQECVLTPFTRINLMDLVLRGTANVMREHGIKWNNNSLLGLDYADV